MLPLVAVVVVALSQAEVTPPQVAAPDLTVVGLEANRGAFFSEHLAQQLTALGFTVVTAKQIGSLLGQERQKQLMGCGDASTSCMAELAAALGSDGIITGTVSKLESGEYQVNVAIVSAKDGKPLAVMSSRESDEPAVLDALTREAPRLAQESFPKLRPGHEFRPATRGVRRYAWIPAVVGAAALGASIGLVLSSWNDSDQLRGTGVYQGMTFTMAEGRSLAASGQTKQTLGFVVGSVGLAALVTAGVLAVLGGDKPAQIVFVPAPGGAAFALSGVWP